MPRPRTDRPTLAGDHTTMTDRELRGHYFAGCGHDSCRAASSEWKRLTPEQKAEAKADPTRRTIAVANEPAATSPAGYVNIPARVAQTQLQSLFALGYDEDMLSDHLPMIVDEIRTVVFSDGPSTDPTDSQARAIGKTFEQLRSTAPNTATKDARARVAENREYAIKNGWVTPDKLAHMDSHEAIDPTPTASFADRMNARLEPQPEADHADVGHVVEQIVEATHTQLDQLKQDALATTAADADPVDPDTRDQTIEDLREEITFLALGLEVRAELYNDLQATNDALTADLARTINTNQQIRMHNAALQLELFAARYEAGELKDLAFHLAEQAPAASNHPAPPPTRPTRRLLAAINARLHPGPRRTQESA